MFEFVYFIAAGITGLLFFIFFSTFSGRKLFQFSLPENGIQSVTMMLCHIKQQNNGKREKKIKYEMCTFNRRNLKLLWLPFINTKQMVLFRLQIFFSLVLF